MASTRRGGATVRRIVAAAIAVAALVAFFALGAYVSPRPPGALDRAAHALAYGRGIALAVPLTTVGRFPAYVAICALSLVLGLVRRAWFVPAAIAIVAILTAWASSDALKEHFMRARPPGQLVFHESTFGYASGHAALALTYYGTWAFFVLRSDLPARARAAIVAAAACLILGIGWSRLALGAHFLTDVAGGYLLGAAFVALVAALSPRLRFVAPQ